jgi:hypothetical protein
VGGATSKLFAFTLAPTRSNKRLKLSAISAEDKRALGISWPTQGTIMPHGTAAETVTPQQVHFRLHNDDELVAKP